MESDLSGSKAVPDAKGDWVDPAAEPADPKLFDSEAVLRAEANLIHPGAPIDDSVKGEKLYEALHARNSTALCLSGGGIRSASFALGVIEALAVHPRPAPGQQAENEDKSLLCQFNYLSTVSGGGYIGSWLSAWISRAGFPVVWKTLIGKRQYPDKEPAEIAWLRAYSNYLTPRTGLLSADTWTAMSLYVRNLMLNWLVIVPALCAALLAVKILAIFAFWLSAFRDAIKNALGGPVPETFGLLEYLLWPLRDPVPALYGIGGVALMVYALRFALLNRPSHDPWTINEDGLQRAGHSAKSRNAEDYEAARVRAGAREKTFWKKCLLLALAAALLLSLYFAVRGPKLADWSLARAALTSMIAGMAIYAIAWWWARPWATWVACSAEDRASRPRLYWVRELLAWLAAGGVYGAMIGVGIRILAKYQPFLMIANADVDHLTSVFLFTFIYGIPWIVTAQLTAEMIFVGLTSWQPHSDSDREWFGRSTGWFATSAFFWFAATFVALIAGETLLHLISKYDWAKYSSALLAGGSALFSTLFGKSSKTPANDPARASFLHTYALPTGAIVFLLAVVIAVSVALDHLMFGRGLIYSSLMTIPSTRDITNDNLVAQGEDEISYVQDVWWLLVGIVAVGVVAFFAWRDVNINRFSAHSLYRNRLIRGYLGASNPKRAPNPFTGFDEDDNIRMHELWPVKKGAWQPFHVVNIALNVVNSNRLAWQERKAEPFTVTPRWCGTAGLGYRCTSQYGNRKKGGITLGTALAISGAAASPNMGYNSSPIVTLLLALFNVRLGWWLGNPGPKGRDTYGNDGPAYAIKPFVSEMFGLTTDDSNYVYLSDGGHFENLGLYEMIRRRCRCIVVSDAGCDPTFSFEDLGNAVRKIAIDLGVYINFGELRSLKMRSKDNSVLDGSYYAVGEIDYQTSPGGSAASENGYILYVKPGYHGNESAGIVAYAAANAAFPHESTADQFFSESQFESYHTLGFEIMDNVLKKAAENVTREAKKKKKKGSPSPDRLCDLIRWLDPKALKERDKRLRVSDGLKLLDKDDLAAMRTILAPPKP